MTDTNDINLFSAAAEMAKDLDSLYKDNRFGKMDLLEFMDANDWFGVPTILNNTTPAINRLNFERVREPLTLWLASYKMPTQVKIKLMLRHFDRTYPHTCRLYREFIQDRQLEDKPSALKLLDFLLSEIEMEITAFSESDLEAFIERANHVLPLGTARLLAEFSCFSPIAPAHGRITPVSR